MAQTYGIYDIDSIPVSTLATLANGLPPDSRSIRKLTGQRYTLDEMLLSTIADRLGVLCWMQSKDGHRNRNRPKSILQELNKEATPKDECLGFSSIEAYEAARAKVFEKGESK